MTALDDLVSQASRRLERAQAARTPCAPVRDLIGDDPTLAYAVQQSGISTRVSSGAVSVGRKIGLTSPVVQKQLGVDQPDFGVLLDTMWAKNTAAIVPDVLLQPRVEAELAFVLSRDITDAELSRADLRAAVDYGVAAIEIVDSRIADWDITFADTVADNGSSGMFVLGTQRLHLEEFDPVDIEMSLSVDGEIVSTGTGAACLGDPLNALAWLARTAIGVGDPLRAGEVILSGALGRMVSVTQGSNVCAQLAIGATSLGTVTVSFAPSPTGTHTQEKS